MAGDWIKMRTGLQRSPSVVRIASALNADRFRTIGALHAVWSLADEQTEDGILPGYTFATVNEMIGWPGFCEALAAVDWARETKAGVTFPDFEKHNGSSAKRRAQEADRKRGLRASASAESSASSSANVSASNADKKRTREEKRRVNTPIPPTSGGFVRFWQAYPRKVAKPAALKAWEKLKPDDLLAERIFRAVASQAVTDQWRKDGGAFIPYPATWLNGRRWEDEIGIAVATPELKLAV